MIAAVRDDVGVLYRISGAVDGIDQLAEILARAADVSAHRRLDLAEHLSWRPPPGSEG